jgi:hypothetical protein
MSTAERWYEKALSSFQSHKTYQGLREFNSALIRSIEADNLSKINTFFIGIAPLLEEQNLLHEAGQIVESFIKHLNKHGKIKKGTDVLLESIKALFETNTSIQIAIIFFRSIINSFPVLQDIEYMNDVLKVSETFIPILKSNQIIIEYLHDHFNGLVFLRNWEKAVPLGQKYFLDNVKSTEMITYAIYTLLIQVLLSNQVEQAINKIKVIKNTLPDELKGLPILEGGAELLLAVKSHDLDWWEETKGHFSDLYRDKIFRIIIGEIYKQFFPEAQTSLLDFFM